MTTTYESWRITFQSDEQAARSAFNDVRAINDKYEKLFKVAADLKMEVKELRADAHRWRWLRDGSGDSPLYPGATIMLFAYNPENTGHEVSDYDAAVDAATK